jgi:glutamate N-acetyltransferase/amino-acid N-acetyltransferase
MARTDKTKAQKKGKKSKAKDAAAGKKKKKSAKAKSAGVSAPQVSPLAPKAFPDLPPVEGVRLSTAAAGIRYRDRADVLLIDVAPGSTLAGVFTRSATRSAAVLDCEAKLAGIGDAPRHGFAVLVNSGNSNTFTGARGARDVATISAAVAEAAGIPPEHVFTSSTGVIGEPLPAERITGVLQDLVAGLTADGFEAAARAIMTTDTFPKGAVERVEIGGTTVTIAGIAKGSGMIAPDMATMLAYVFTDAHVTRDGLQAMLTAATKKSFNAITVDGDTSTSDTVLMAATGRAKGPKITSGRSAEGRAFAAALGRVMQDLALQIVKDGEGATKLVEVRVTGAKSARDADKVARAIANSPLVKTAIAGEDPNWGRIVMAVGKSGATADRDLLEIRLGDILVAEKGWVAESYREEDGAAYMKGEHLTIGVEMGLGRGAATVWTCDLTARYVEINADYRS